MKGIIIVGTQDFGYECAQSALKAGIPILQIYTSLPPPHEHWDKNLDDFAKENTIPFAYVTKFNESHAQHIQTLDADLMLVAGWRFMIDEVIYSIPRLGALAIHASKLPKYRGFAPMTWPIINGETETGVSIFKLAPGVDEGDILAQQTIPIEETDTGKTLRDKIILASTDLIKSHLKEFIEGRRELNVQNHSKASYSYMRLPEDSIIDWSKSARTIYNLVRALVDPYPNAFTYYDGDKVNIISAHVLDSSAKRYGTPGSIVNIDGASVHVLTGEGILVVDTIRVGGKDMSAAQHIKSIRKRLGYNYEQELHGLHIQVHNLQSNFKEQMRIMLREKLENVPERHLKDKIIQDSVAKHVAKYRGEPVLVYVSKDYEVCTHDLIRALLNHCTVVVPYFSNETNSYNCSVIKSFDDLVEGKFGILEPKKAYPVPVSELVACVLPGLSFDYSNTRLGRGTGSFDRFLATLPAEKIGICYEMQRVRYLPTGSLDVPMDVVITEKGVYENS